MEIMDYSIYGYTILIKVVVFYFVPKDVMVYSNQ